MIDWNAVKTAYITTGRNCSDLAREFGVTAARVYQRAREEGWQEHRAEHESGKLPENKYACLVYQNRRTVPADDVFSLPWLLDRIHGKEV